MHILGGARVLLVEDEFWTALDVANHIEAAGGEVVGPYATTTESLEALETEAVSAAVLDANLADRDVTPVALWLIAHGVPIVVHTGRGLPAELKECCPELPVLTKPADPVLLVAAVAHQILHRRAQPRLSH